MQSENQWDLRLSLCLKNKLILMPRIPVIKNYLNHLKVHHLHNLNLMKINLKTAKTKCLLFSFKTILGSLKSFLGAWKTNLIQTITWINFKNLILNQ